MARKRKRSKVELSERYKYNMKTVTSAVCEACKTKCNRGMNYIEKMSKHGAVGKGVPCILTKGKAYK